MKKYKRPNRKARKADHIRLRNAFSGKGAKAMIKVNDEIILTLQSMLPLVNSDDARIIFNVRDAERTHRMGLYIDRIEVGQIEDDAIKNIYTAVAVIKRWK